MLMEEAWHSMHAMGGDDGGTGVLLGIGLGLLGVGLVLSLLGAKCPRCAARVENGAPYCPGCGASLAWPSP